MINIDATWDGYEALNNYIDRVTTGLSNLDPLINDIVEVLVEDNREARLAGEDKDGAPMVEVIPYRGRPGDGPPLVPEGGSARLITEFNVETERKSDSEWIIVAGWPSVEWLKYHVEGSGGGRSSLFEPQRSRGRSQRTSGFVTNETGRQLPIRDPRGLRPVGQVKMEATIRFFLEGLLDQEGPTTHDLVRGDWHGPVTASSGVFERRGGRTILGARSFRR